MGDNARVRILRDVAEFETIRKEWELWSGNRDSEINSFTTFMHSNPGALRPHIIVIYSGDRPDAIFVGRIDKGHIACRLGYLRLNLSARVLCFVYGAFRGNPSSENCELIVRSVLRSLSDGEADAAYMNFLDERSDLFALATKVPGILSRDYVRATQQHYTAQLPSTVDDFYRGLSPKVRKNQKWQSKRLDKHFPGAVTVRCFRAVGEIDELVRDVEQIAAKSYQRAIGVGFIDSANTRSQLRLKAGNGWLRGYVLYLGGRPCAFWLGDVNAGVFGSDYIGYDAEFASHSPGMYLIMRVVEGFCNGNGDGVSGIDFGTGYAQYKEILSNREFREISVYMFAPTVKGISLNAVRTVVGRTDLAFKAVLDRTNLLQRAKKAWRSHAKLKEVAHDA